MEFVEIELGGIKRKARLTITELIAIARDELCADPLKLTRELATFEGENFFLGNPWALQVLLFASLRAFDPKITIGDVGRWIADRDIDERRWRATFNKAITTERESNNKLTYFEAAQKVANEQPEISKGSTLLDLVLGVIAARDVGGTEADRPNVETPALH